MYIARDKNGALYVYTKVPVKREDLGVWMAESRCNRSTLLPINITLPKSINPQWNDPKPIKVKLVRNNK